MKALIAFICAFFLTASAIAVLKGPDGSLIMSEAEVFALITEIQAIQQENAEMREALIRASEMLKRCKTEIKT